MKRGALWARAPWTLLPHRGRGYTGCGGRVRRL